VGYCNCPSAGPTPTLLSIFRDLARPTLEIENLGVGSRTKKPGVGLVTRNRLLVAQNVTSFVGGSENTLIHSWLGKGGGKIGGWVEVEWWLQNFCSVRACVRSCVRACVRACVHACVCLCVCESVCFCLCVCTLLLCNVNVFCVVLYFLVCVCTN